VACMGACSQAPVMRIGDNTYGGLTPDKTRRIMRILKSDIGVEEG
jgi:NADH:ubiquinone oxidoreductase subunit E